MTHEVECPACGGRGVQIMTPMPATVAERKGAISTRLVPCPRCEGYGISPLNQPVDELAEDE